MCIATRVCVYIYIYIITHIYIYIYICFDPVASDCLDAKRSAPVRGNHMFNTTYYLSNAGFLQKRRTMCKTQRPSQGEPHV